MHDEAEFRAIGLGMPSLALATIPAEISQADIDMVNSIADTAVTNIIIGLTSPGTDGKERRTGNHRN